MGKVFLGVQCFYAEFDISGDANSLETSYNQEILESRTFNSNFVKKDTGMYNDSLTLSGQLSFEDPGTAFFDNLGSNIPVSAALDGATAAEQDRVLFADAVNGSLSGPSVQGQLRTFTLDMMCDGPIVFGYCLGNGQKTSSGNTAAGASAGAVADGQSIWAVVHCTAATSGTVDIIIESAATGDSGFASPTTRLTFTQIATTDTYEVKTDKPSGGITDTLWRAKWTGASTPDHTFMVAFGITPV
jgi:hypothetical protein